jgi:hypothetical protein
MPVIGLRVHAYHLLGLAVKADEEGRASDAYELTAKAIEHLEDAMSVDEFRRNSLSIGATSGKQSSNESTFITPPTNKSNPAAADAIASVLKPQQQTAFQIAAKAAVAHQELEWRLAFPLSGP